MIINRCRKCSKLFEMAQGQRRTLCDECFKEQIRLSPGRPRKEGSNACELHRL